MMVQKIVLRHKETGEEFEGYAESRDHGPNFQARACWDRASIMKMAYGETIEGALQAAFDKFSSLPVLSDYEIKLA